MDLPESKFWHLKIKYGFSNAGSDLDNPTKMVMDILSKKYRFNDNRIYKLTMHKHLVDKGDEYFAFEFRPLTENKIRKINQKKKKDDKETKKDDKETKKEGQKERENDK